jgi:7 transmembrane receptor (rhodopsin family)
VSCLEISLNNIVVCSPAPTLDAVTKEHSLAAMNASVAERLISPYYVTVGYAYHSPGVESPILGAASVATLLDRVPDDGGTEVSGGFLPENAEGPEPLSAMFKALVSVLYTVVIVLAVGGNAIICCIVATQRRMQTVTNLFIVSLGCSDVLMATLCIPLTFVSNVLVHYWPFGAVMCPIALYAQVICSADCLQLAYSRFF